MAIAICATVISGLSLLQESEVFHMLDHELAVGIKKVHSGMQAFHDKLHHKAKTETPK